MPPDDDFDDFLSDNDWLDIFGDEVPGLGKLKRAAKIAKKIVAKEYIQEIKKLKSREQKLIDSSSELVSLIRDYRKIITENEDKIAELEAKIADLKAKKDDR